VPDLDADQAALPRQVEQARDAEPADPELVTDLDLGPAVQLVAPRDHGGEHQRCGAKRLR
jgi:hypothetical protein